DRFARFRAQRELNEKIQKFLVDEGVAVWLEPSPGDDGTVFVSGGGGRDPKDPPAPPRVAVANENYGRLVRMLEKKVPVTLQADIVFIGHRHARDRKSTRLNSSHLVISY